MRISKIGCAAALVLMVVAAHAQTPSGSTGFEKKNYNHSEWTKGLFSEVVTVTHPGKMIFLAGSEPRTRMARAVPLGISEILRASASTRTKRLSDCWRSMALQ